MWAVHRPKRFASTDVRAQPSKPLCSSDTRSADASDSIAGGGLLTDDLGERDRGELFEPIRGGVTAQNLARADRAQHTLLVMRALEARGDEGALLHDERAMRELAVRVLAARQRARSIVGRKP